MYIVPNLAAHPPAVIIGKIDRGKYNIFNRYLMFLRLFWQCSPDKR